MPLPPLRVLCVHGVNTSESDASWQGAWSHEIEAGVQRWNPGREVDTRYVAYNDLFKAAPLNAWNYLDAVRKLLASGLSSAFGSRTEKTRDFGGVTQAVRWTAGMVVQWVENEALRSATRRLVQKAVEDHDPDVVLAHSLGSLLCYDTFVHGAGQDAIRNRTFVSFGSQIGNPFVRNTFGGRLVGLGARFWYHLFNQHDLETFTWPIRIDEANFAQIDADFDLAGILDHDAAMYLSHRGMLDTVWRETLGSSIGARGFRTGPKRARGTVRPSALRPERTERRALLVGINDYPDPANQLEGCVNDVFLISSLLQECGFEAEDIRVVLDDRATAQGIRDRLEWLLDGTQEGDQRVFFYSGHGAQMPAYSSTEKIDHKDECLVPYDFDWSPERAVTDDQFFDLYSQLPYKSNFIAILDCCHSGGMERGGIARVRGLSPPDDIRHRDMRWSLDHRMWVPRDFKPINRSMRGNKARVEFFGASGVDHRLGRAAPLRRLENQRFNRVRSALGHYGPYMPLILQACGESELASEYKNGATSNGAFTFCLAKTLRASRQQGRNLSFDRLVRSVRTELHELDYDQTPVVAGPGVKRRAMVPWTRRARRTSS